MMHYGYGGILVMDNSPDRDWILMIYYAVRVRKTPGQTPTQNESAHGCSEGA